MVIATDGVWEVIQNEDAMDIATQSWKEKFAHMSIIDDKNGSPSDELVDAAIRAGTRDNVTAIVLKIRFERPTGVLFGSCQCQQEEEEEEEVGDEGASREFIGSLFGGSDRYSASCCMDNEVVDVHNPRCYIQRRNNCLRSRLL